MDWGRLSTGLVPLKTMFDVSVSDKRVDIYLYLGE